MQSLAELVKAHRGHLGLNTTDYAERVGVSRQNIENVEAEKVRQPRYIDKLARAMGTTVDALLRGERPNWTHEQHPSEGVGSHTVAHDLGSTDYCVETES